MPAHQLLALCSVSLAVAAVNHFVSLALTIVGARQPIHMLMRCSSNAFAMSRWLQSNDCNYGPELLPAWPPMQDICDAHVATMSKRLLYKIDHGYQHLRVGIPR